MSTDLEQEIRLTTAAENKVLELMEVEENSEIKLRIYIIGGGCSGYEYGFAFDEKPIKEDDILAFKNAGAYCYSMASNYNSRYRPAEVLWYKKKAHLIRKRETFEDILHNQVEVTL